MKNNSDFILKVENEGVLCSLNRLVHKRFDTATTVWSDSASHNILLFVTSGEALLSGGFSGDTSRPTSLHRKVTLLPIDEPFIIEFQAGCEVLAYSFDNYLPMDTAIYEGIACSSDVSDNEHIAFDIPKVLYWELVSVSKNIGRISSNEILTHLTMRKVTALMQKSLKPAQTAKLFVIKGSKLGGEIFRYMKIAENRTNLTKKSARVIF